MAAGGMAAGGMAAGGTLLDPSAASEGESRISSCASKGRGNGRSPAQAAQNNPVQISQLFTTLLTTG
jgi:hypothetical protein